MAAVHNLCNTGILLQEGRVKDIGAASKVAQNYLQSSRAFAEIALQARHDRKGNGALQFTGFSTSAASGEPTAAFLCGSTALLNLHILPAADRKLRGVRIAVGVDNSLGSRVVTLSTNLATGDFPVLPPETRTVRLEDSEARTCARPLQHHIVCQRQWGPCRLGRQCRRFSRGGWRLFRKRQSASHR